MTRTPMLIIIILVTVLLPIFAQNSTSSPDTELFSTLPTVSESIVPATDLDSSTSTNVPSSTTISVRNCRASVADPTFCAYEDTQDEKCDICLGMNCTAFGHHKVCRQSDSKCLAVCYCPYPMQEGPHGDCIDPCDQNPCKNGGVCNVGMISKREYTCTCAAGWEGDNCEIVQNVCLRPSPGRCPKGSYQCTMMAPNNYSCECAPGFWRDTTNKECVRVDEVAHLKMHFVEIPYSEIYNNVSYSEAIKARSVIKSVLTAVFSERLVSYQIQNFTQGSLIANLDIFLKRKEGDQTNQYTYKKHLLDCSLEDNTSLKPECGGFLGKISPDVISWAQKDEVCANVACPEHTRCEAVKGTVDTTQCSCDVGFKGTGSKMSTTGQLIETCEDIDECALNSSCSKEETCVNRLGTYECLSPCKEHNCPGHSHCVNVGTTFECQCSWIYAGSACSFPWTLILLILSCIFLASTILVTMLLIASIRSGRRASYKVNIPLSMN